MEIAVDGGYHSPADVEAMTGLIGAQIARLPATTKVIVAADWRGVHLMNPDTAARAHAMLTAQSPRIERSALLVSGTSSTEMLQFVRLVRESAHPSRRIFDHVRGMKTFLSERLESHEATRLDAFLTRLPP
jgi:hypothetical protein